MITYISILVNDKATEKLIEILKKERSNVKDINDIKKEKNFKHTFDNRSEYEYSCIINKGIINKDNYNWKVIDSINNTNQIYLNVLNDSKTLFN